MTGTRNVAAVLGGWSVRHRKTAVLGWLLFVVLATWIGTAAGQRQMTNAEYAAGDSARAMSILEESGVSQPAGEMVLVHSATLTVDAAEFRAVVDQLVTGIQATGQVTNLREPYAAGLVSSDRHSVLIQFAVTGKAETAPDRVQPVLDAVATAAAAHPTITAEEFGEASANKWFNDTVLRDFSRAEWTAVPLAIGILIVAFGAVLAAVLPVGLAMTAFFAANGILALISYRMHVSNTTSSVMLMLGLAVGVDYCLFYLRREREERTAGHDAATALRVAAATSGRSVLVSGLTVVMAMAGMFLSGLLLFAGFALATILVVLVAMLGSVTVLPALLSLLGDRVDLGRIPGLVRLRRPQGGSRLWAAILRPVLARPGLSATAAALFLIALAAPVVGIHTEKLSLDKQLPADTPIIQTYHHIEAAFPGGPDPATVVVHATDVQAPEVRRAIKDFTVAALRTGLVNQPIQANSLTQRVAEISVPLAGTGSDRTSEAALRTLRDDVIPATLGTVPGTEAYVTGTSPSPSTSTRSFGTASCRCSCS